MATSGTVYSSKAKSSKLYVKWSVDSQSTSGNYTTVKWTAGIVNGNSWYSNAIKISSIYINGTKVSGSHTYSNITSSGTIQKLSGSLNVPHNANGTKSMTVKISGWFIDYGDKSGSETFALPTIARASTISCPSAFTAGTAGTISITRKSSNFTHTASCSLGNTGLSATSGIATSFTYKPPYSLFNSSDYKNTTSRKGTITVQTKNGSTSIGNALTKTITVTLPENNDTKPTASLSGSWSEVGTDYLNTYGVLIAGKSKLKTTCSSEAKYSAKVANYYISMSGCDVSINSDKTEITTGYLTTAANGSVLSYYVKDTRGFTSKAASLINPYTVVEYRKPSINAFSVVRVNDAGKEDPVNGTKLKFKVNYYVDPIAISNECTQNTAMVKIYQLSFNAEGTVAGRTELTGLNIVNGEYTELTADTYAKNQSFAFEATISDGFTDEAAMGSGTRVYARTAKTLMSFYEGDGITFGRLADASGFNVAMDSSFEKSLSIGSARFEYDDSEGVLKLTFLN